MGEKAHITSIDAIEAFRSNLVIYVSKARPTVEEVSSDILRVKLWLQNEQRMKLEAEVKRRTRVLEEAQAALFSSRIAVLKQEGTAEQLAMQRARRGLQEVEEKLRRLKAWSRDFDSRVEPMLKQLEKLHSVLSTDMLKATHFLAEKVKSLQAYTELSPSVESSSPGNPAAGSASPGSSEAVSGQVTGGES